MSLHQSNSISEEKKPQTTSYVQCWACIAAEFRKLFILVMEWADLWIIRTNLVMSMPFCFAERTEIAVKCKYNSVTLFGTSYYFKVF